VVLSAMITGGLMGKIDQVKGKGKMLDYKALLC
jgi:hypothetical protein